MGRLPRSKEMRSRKEDSEDEESDDDSSGGGSFVVAAKAANSQQWSTSRRHSDTKKRKKHTNEEGEEWSESQQKKDIIAAFLDPNSGIHTLSIPTIEEYAADHGWIKSNATSNIRTIKKQYEGKKGPFSEKEVNKIEPFKTRTTKSKAYTLLPRWDRRAGEGELGQRSTLLSTTRWQHDHHRRGIQRRASEDFDGDG